jgi:signal transduction histidine kinase
MPAERSVWPWREHWIDIAWGVFAVANLIAMMIIPDWETVPFHFIWVSLTILYGFRVWRVGPTALVLAVVIVTTAAAIWATIDRGYQPLDELTEVPLMAAMFLAMVWHAQRRLHAMEESERVSMANLRLLEREHRFVQDASHELRTPITVALGHAELIQRRTDDDVTAEDAAVIADELLRLRRLADRLLVLAGSEDPGFLHRIDVELEEIVSDAVRRWAATPRRWLVRSDGEARVRADPERLAVALDALIENAVNHTREGDTIQIGEHGSATSAVIWVRDSGTGIPAADLDRIFDRFARADPGRGRRNGGFGLGLSIVRTIVEAHGGRIDAASSEGKGTMFEIELPVAEGPLPRAEIPRQVAVAAMNEREAR